MSCAREQEVANHTNTMQFQQCTSRCCASGTQGSYDYLTKREMSTRESDSGQYGYRRGCRVDDLFSFSKSGDGGMLIGGT